jgi:hypothetical protein
MHCICTTGFGISLIVELAFLTSCGFDKWGLKFPKSAKLWFNMKSGHTSGSKIEYCIRLIFSLSINDCDYTALLIDIFNISTSFPRSLHQGKTKEFPCLNLIKQPYLENK